MEEHERFLASVRFNYAINTMTNRLESICQLGIDGKIKAKQLNDISNVLIQMDKIINDIMEDK